MKNLILLDFNKIALINDILSLFIKFAFNKKKYYIAVMKCMPYIIGNKAGIVSHNTVMRHLVKCLFRRMPNLQLQDLGERFAPKYKDSIISPLTQQIIDNYINNGDIVYIYTSNIGELVAPLFNNKLIKMTASTLETDENGLLTGRFETQNLDDINVLKPETIIPNFQLYNIITPLN